MKWLTAALLAIVVAPCAAAQTYGSWNGQCSKGGQAVVTQGLVSSGTQPILGGTVTNGSGVLASYPSCTVAVYLTGTLTPASLFQTSSGTVLVQPFTANTDGSFLFYASPLLYDVVISGGGMPSPFTFTAVTVNLPGGGGGSMVYPGIGVARSSGTAWLTSLGVQGTDTNLLTSGTISGTSSPLCTDALGGATTVSCPAGGTLTSIGLSTTATWLTVGNSPLIANGTITLNPTPSLTANQFIATPNGSTGSVILRSIVGADLPAINLAASGAGGVTGNLPIANLNSGTGATASTFWRGDNSWATPVAGTVNSVGLQINAGSSSGIFAVTGSPVTNTGILNYNLTGTSGGMPYFSSTSVLSSSGVLAAGNFVLGGGAGASPTATFSVIPTGVGGTGVVSPTAHTVGIAEGASPFAFVSPGASGQCFMSNGVSSDPTFQACPPGFANPMTTLGDFIVGGASGVATRLAGPTGPNGIPQSVTSTPSGGLAVAQAWSIPGVSIDQQTGTSYTIPVTDDGRLVTGNNVGATAWTGFTLANNYVFSGINLGAGLIMYTPASGLVNNAVSQIIPQYYYFRHYTDNANTIMPVMPTIKAFPSTTNGQSLGFNSATGQFSVVTPPCIPTTPTISSGFGTSPSVSAGTSTCAFRVNVGTGGTANTGVIGLPAAPTGWNCFATDITTASGSQLLTKQTASTTTTASLANYNSSGTIGAWVASDILAVSCFDY